MPVALFFRLFLLAGSLFALEPEKTDAFSIPYKQLGEELNRQETSDSNYSVRREAFQKLLRELSGQVERSTIAEKYLDRVRKTLILDEDNPMSERVEKNGEFYAYFDFVLYHLIALCDAREHDVSDAAFRPVMQPRLVKAFLDQVKEKTQFRNYALRRSFILDFSASALATQISATEKVRLLTYMKAAYQGNLREGIRHTDMILEMLRPQLQFGGDDLMKDLFAFNQAGESKQVETESSSGASAVAHLQGLAPREKSGFHGKKRKELFAVGAGAAVLAILLFLLFRKMSASSSAAPLSVPTPVPYTQRTPFMPETSADKVSTQFDPISQMMVSELPDRYAKIWKISKGGMGVVFGAEDTLLQRKVAIKMISPSMTDDPQIVTRFVNEARAVASLDHPNILKIYDVGQGQFPYFVMEYLQGLSLEELIDRKKKLIAEEVHSFGFQIAEALSYCHAKGIIHRDIKPANILVVGNNRFVKLVDFGIAKDKTKSGVTQSNVSIGSPSYMAPEQLQKNEYGAHSDIYAFGMTLYKMACGQLPFEESEIVKRLTAPPTPLKSFIPDFNKLLMALIMKCIERHPQDRFNNFEQIRGVLLKIKF